VVLVPASRIAHEHGVRVSPLWLVAVYFIHTLGELCLSPVGLSTVTKLAPVRLVGLMMGVWFLAAALGNKAAGWIGGQFDPAHLARIFGAVGGITIAAGFVLALLVKPMRRLTTGVR
jgi:POT family proton-dependent oligopeptide transporter